MVVNCRQCYVKVKSSCDIASQCIQGNSGSLFLNNKSMVSKIKNPNGDPWDRFFYPSLKPRSHCADVATVHPDAGQPVYCEALGHIS